MHSVAAGLNCRSGHEANVEIMSKVMNIVVHPQRFEILGRGVCSSNTPSVYIINYEVLYLPLHAEPKRSGKSLVLCESALPKENFLHEASWPPQHCSGSA